MNPLTSSHLTSTTLSLSSTPDCYADTKLRSGRRCMPLKRSTTLPPNRPNTTRMPPYHLWHLLMIENFTNHYMHIPYPVVLQVIVVERGYMISCALESFTIPCLPSSTSLRTDGVDNLYMVTDACKLCTRGPNAHDTMGDVRQHGVTYQTHSRETLANVQC